ncbi:MAG: L,D-transpeptidase family protein [Steroidobacteraceae bacterium]
MSLMPLRSRAALAAGLLLVAALCVTVGVQAAVYALPAQGALIGRDRLIHSKSSDTLLAIARKYSVGYWEIQAANPHVDMWLPGQGTPVVIPGRYIIPPVAHVGIVVNLAAHRLFYFPRRSGHDRPVVITYPVSPGEKGWDTPTGLTRIVRKVPHPVWIPTPSILRAHAAAGDPIARVWPAGPNNPMGEWALQTTLSGGEIYIHGTNNPMAIGMAVTHGCVRLYPEDIAALFPVVPVGTKVTIVNDPILATLQDGRLYLSIHPPLHSQNVPAKPNFALISRVIRQALGGADVAVDWARVRRMSARANGIPQLIGVQAGRAPAHQRTGT